MRFIPALILLFLTACTVPKADKNYQLNTESAVGVLAYSNSLITRESSAYIKRVDLETNKFIGPEIRFSTCVSCLPYANTFKLENKFMPEFFMMELPPGTYAFVGMWINSGRYVNFCRATPAFEIKAGKINVVVQDLAKYPEYVNLDEVKKAANSYKGIVGEVALAHTSKVVTFDQANEKGEGCPYYLGVTTFNTVDWDEFAARNSNNILK